jgi:hypothetical protein
MSTAFRVVLSGAQETPPNTSTASGLGTVIFDDKAVTASYSFRIVGLDFGPVTGGPAQTPATDDDVTRTHFHNQQAGIAGAIVFGQLDPAAQFQQDKDDLRVVRNSDGSSTMSGVWETTDPVNSSGLSIANFAGVLGSAPVGTAVPLYWNVHTNRFPGGEIRGQLVAIADDNDNFVQGTTGNDLLAGLGGNDALDGTSSGTDTLDGGAGNDAAFFAGTLRSHSIDFVTLTLSSPADGIDIVRNIENFRFADGAVSTADGNPTVDDLFYSLRNQDVWNARADPDAHYATFGWREGRDPNAFFSTVGYLAANPDVKAAGINPLDHYNRFGWKEGRDPGGNFDTSFYLIHNPDVARANVNPLEHYLQFGRFEARQILPAVGFPSQIPSTDFDPEFYLLSNPDVAAAGVNPSNHFFTFGSKEGRDPNGQFDTSFYLSHNPDVAASGMNPLLHYGQFGWKEGRNPSESFSTNGYLAANPDVKAAGVNPLDHFLHFGLYEGRLP